MTRLVLALLVLLALPSSAAAAGLETVIQDDRLLLHQPAEEVDQAMAGIRATGAERVRLTANWSSLAPMADSVTKPEGIDLSDPAAYEQPRWQRLDDAVRLAHKNGLLVSIDIGFWAPVWATADKAGPRAKTHVDPKAYADFAVALVKRYGGEFTPPVPPADAPPPEPSQDEQDLQEFLGDPTDPRVTPDPDRSSEPAPEPTPIPRVDRFILWNEPNHHALLEPQWSPDGKPLSPVVYRNMVMAAYPAAKAVRPDATILIGNTSSSGGAWQGGSGPVAPLLFVRELACVDRKLRPRTDGNCANFSTVPGDGWAHHPYAKNLPPDTLSKGKRRDDILVGDLPRLGRTLDKLVAKGRFAPAVREIHITEFGYETEPLGDRPGVPQDKQALYLTWGERLANRVPNVKSWAQFLLRDQPPAPHKVSESLRRPFGQFWTGLYGSDGREKLAAQTFRAGLLAERRGRRGLDLWARLRLGEGVKRVVVERSVLGRPWRPLRTSGPAGGRLEGSFLAEGRESFARSARYVRGAKYRLVIDGAPVGLPVPTVGKAPPKKPRRKSSRRAERRVADRRGR